MGLLYLSAYIRDRFDVDIRIVNQRLENFSVEELARQAKAHQADIVGLSCFTTFSFLLPSLSESMRAALPEALVILGGPHASATKAEAMKYAGIDMVIPGEGEITFEMILERWGDNRVYDDIPGLIWRDGEEVRVNPGISPQVPDLDTLPFPAYDLIDMPAYWRSQSIAPIKNRRYVSLVSSRGCPYGCVWCHKIFGKHIRMHSAERIADEMGYYQKTYGIKDFEFLDDNVNFRPKRVLDLVDLLKQRNIQTELAFPTAVRGDLVTEEVVDAMAAAGTYLCGYSLETGSPRLQQYTCKRLNIPRFLKAVEMTAKKHIYITGFCMMGFPTETEEELQLTIDVACSSRFHTASFFTVTPFPGTPLFEMVKAMAPEKLEKLRFDDMDFSAMNVNLTDLPDEVLFSYQRKAMRRFFMNPRRIASLLRSYPKPYMLPVYAPIFLHRATKGLWKTD